MGDLRNKLRKLTRIFFTGAYYEYDFGTEDEINVPSGIRFWTPHRALLEIDSLSFYASDAMIAVTISLDTLAVAYAH